MTVTLVQTKVVSSGSWSSTDDRLYAHEAAGLLVGGEDLAPEQQLTCLSALMQPLLSQIEQYLPAVKGGLPATNGVAHSKGEKLPVNMVLQVTHVPFVRSPPVQ